MNRGHVDKPRQNSTGITLYGSESCMQMCGVVGPMTTLALRCAVQITAKLEAQHSVHLKVVRRTRRTYLNYET